MTESQLAWVVASYSLALGALLLLGGRVGDFMGRKRIFLVGLAGFAAVSGLGALSTDASMLIAARVGQGVFAALLTPAALALLTVTFTDPGERAKAFAVYGSIAGGGMAVGLILGGLLTQYVSWRWTLGVNVPISLVALFLGVKYLTESRAEGDAGTTFQASSCPRSGSASWCTGSPSPAKWRAAGRRRGRCRCSWADSRCWPSSSSGRRSPAIRCCRCGSSWIAIAAAPTWRSSSPRSGSRHCSSSSPSTSRRDGAVAGCHWIGLHPVRRRHRGLIHADGLTATKTGPRPLVVGGALIASCGMFMLSRLTANTTMIYIVIAENFWSASGWP